MSKSFRLWLEQVNIQLPPIPPDSVRLTHYTSERIAQGFVSGQPFNYQRVGIITSTTDAFSNLNDIYSLLQSGSTGAFSRQSFGNCVLLMDMTNWEHKLRSTRNIPPIVSNDRILGYINLETNNFIRNNKYVLPSQQEQPTIPQQPNLGTAKPNPVPIPAPSAVPSSNNFDVF